MKQADTLLLLNTKIPTQANMRGRAQEKGPPYKYLNPKILSVQKRGFSVNLGTAYNRGGTESFVNKIILNSSTNIKKLT